MKIRKWSIGIDYVHVLKAREWIQYSKYITDIHLEGVPSLFVEYQSKKDWTIMAKAHAFYQYPRFGNLRYGFPEDGDFYFENIPMNRRALYIDILLGYELNKLFHLTKFTDRLNIKAYLGIRSYIGEVLYNIGSITNFRGLHPVMLDGPGFFSETYTLRPTTQLMVEYRVWKGLGINSKISYAYNKRNCNPTMIHLGLGYTF